MSIKRRKILVFEVINTTIFKEGNIRQPHNEYQQIHFSLQTY